MPDPKYKDISFRDKDIDKVYELKTKSGSTIEVGGKSVSSARNRTDYLKSRGTYKGKTLDSGVKLNDGTFIRTTNPVDRKKASKKLEYDKKLFKADSIRHEKTVKSFQNAEFVRVKKK